MENPIFPILLGGVLWLLIMYYVIRSAVDVKNRNQQLEKQTNLLAAIARKNGVPEDEINACLES